MPNLTTASLIEWIAASAAALEKARSLLCELDGPVGDGDHGSSMAEGMRAAAQAVQNLRNPDSVEVFRTAGHAFHDRVGATVGPLYAAAFYRCAERSDEDSGVASVLGDMCEGITSLGGAQPGDCTMIDAWHPAARAALASAQAGDLPWQQAVAASRAAQTGMESTRAMVATCGRTARLGTRSLGHLDPGARSATLIVQALSEILETGT